MSEHQSPEKKPAAQLKEAGAESVGKQQSAPAFNLSANPVQRATPPEGGTTPAVETAAPVADPAQVPGVVAEKTQAAPAAPTDADPNKKYADLVAENPATNVEIATWVLKAASEDIGFVTWNDKYAKPNWEGIRDGKKTGSVADPSTAEVLKALPTVVALVKARVNRYIAAGHTGAKETLELGSFMNGRGGTHGDGQAIDINDLNFTSSVDEVIQLLKDLPAGKKYGIGLPSQGEFFDPAFKLATLEKTAEAAGKATTLTGYRHGKTGNYTATYTPPVPATDKTPEVKGKWDYTTIPGGNALKLYMKSQKVKDAIAALTAGSYCYPDNDSHIHVDTMS